jgi:c-di-GMP-related signal transduction protein
MYFIATAAGSAWSPQEFGRGFCRDALDLANALERADWEAISSLLPKLGIKEEQIPAIYFSAVVWASAIRSGVRVSVA